MVKMIFKKKPYDKYQTKVNLKLKNSKN